MQPALSEMSQMNVRQSVRDYVTKVLRENKDDTAAVSDSESLVMSGRLSSLDVVDVVTFLETQFSYTIDASDFDVAKFDSIDQITALVEAMSVTK